MNKKVIIPGQDKDAVVHSELTIYDVIIARNSKGNVTGIVVQVNGKGWGVHIGNTGQSASYFDTLQKCIIGYSKEYTFEVIS